MFIRLLSCLADHYRNWSTVWDASQHNRYFRRRTWLSRDSTASMYTQLLTTSLRCGFTICALPARKVTAIANIPTIQIIVVAAQVYVSVVQPLWVSRVSRHPKNSGWGVWHSTVLVYLVPCNWLLNCSTSVFMPFLPCDCMQCNARYCCRNSVRPSVCLSVRQMRVLWQN